MYVNIPAMAGKKYFTRYFDQVCRMAVSLHAFSYLAKCQLKRKEPSCVPTVIGLETLQSAKYLVDTLTLQKTILLQVGELIPINLFILFGVLHRFQHCTGHIMTGSWKGRGNQYIQFVRVLYGKLPTNGKQLPAFPPEVVPGIEPRPQRWEARVLPLCHHGPSFPLR